MTRKLRAAGDLYGRAVKEWIGKDADSKPPPRVLVRICLRQNGKCAISGSKLVAGRVQFDHIIRLKDNGENRESNYQAITIAEHKRKSARERALGAKVERLQKQRFGIDQRPSRLVNRGFTKAPLKNRKAGPKETQLQQLRRMKIDHALD